MEFHHLALDTVTLRVTVTTVNINPLKLSRRGQLSPEGLQKSVEGTKRQNLTVSKAVFTQKKAGLTHDSG